MTMISVGSWFTLPHVLPIHATGAAAPKDNCSVRPSGNNISAQIVLALYPFHQLHSLFVTMLYHASFAALAVLIFAPLINADGLYSKGSSVLQVDGKNYDKLIKNSKLASVCLMI